MDKRYSQFSTLSQMQNPVTFSPVDVNVKTYGRPIRDITHLYLKYTWVGDIHVASVNKNLLLKSIIVNVIIIYRIWNGGMHQYL